MKKYNPKKGKSPTKKQSSVIKEPDTVRIRHQSFDGFDIYTAVVNDKHILFHKPQTKKLVIADTYKFLGSFENLWLCEDLVSGLMHIAPFDRFTQLTKDIIPAKTSSSSISTEPLMF